MNLVSFIGEKNIDHLLKQKNCIPILRMAEREQWCGSVDTSIASDTRGPRFKSSHQQNFKMNTFTINC